MSKYYKLSEIPSEYKNYFKIWYRKSNIMYYLVYKSINNFLDYYNNCDNKFYHEVYEGNDITKLKIDYDSKTKDFDYKNFILSLITYIKLIYDIDININSFVILSASSFPYSSSLASQGSKEEESEGKYSYHIILNDYLFYNNISIKYILDKVVDIHDINLKDHIDFNIYKNGYCNFRMIYSYTSTKTRPLLPIDINGNILDNVNIKRYLINYTNNNEKIIGTKNAIDCLKSPIIYNINNEIYALFEQLGFLENFKFKSRSGNYYWFTRTNPSYCKICDRIHDNENSLVVAKKDKYIIEYCRRNNLEKNINHGIFNIKSDFTINDICYKSKNIQKDFINDHIIINVSSLSSLQKSDWEHKTLIIYSPMKTSKTKSLINYINNNFEHTDKIRWLSFRITYSVELLKKINNFIAYYETDNNMSHDELNWLLIQIESLHKIVMPSCAEKPKLLVIDEIRSILTQWISPHHKCLAKSFAYFRWLMKYSEQIICMDANINNEILEILNIFRDPKSIVLVQNNYKIAENEKYYITKKFDKFCKQIQKCLDRNKNIAIISNSIKKAEAFNKVIKKLYPSKKIYLYTAKTPSAIKKKHLKDVNTTWQECDVLIYTPTITAGISFEKEHYDYLFAYFTNKSCDVECCRQMIGRIRNIKRNKFYICLKTSPTEKIDNPEELEHQIIYRNNVMNIPVSIDITYLESGKYEISNNDFYKMWVLIICMHNKSLNNFLFEFINQLKSLGANVIDFDDDLNYIDCAIYIEFLTVEEELTIINNAYIVNAENITEEEFADLSNKIEKDDNDILKMNKYLLKKTYNLSSLLSQSESKEEIDINFVEKYNNTLTKKVYNNLRYICSHSEMKNAINNLATSYQVTTKLDSRYISNKIGYDILTKLNFGCIFDRKEVFCEIIDDIIFSNDFINYIEENSSQILMNFEIYGERTRKKMQLLSGNKTEYIEETLKNINKILMQLYFIKIKRNINGKYKLDTNKIYEYFTTSTNNKNLKPYLEIKLNTFLE